MNFMEKQIKFMRFGGLSPVIQKGYTTNPDERGFHTPPARKGFYAFIWPYYDLFLIGGEYSRLGTKYKNAKYEYLKDKNGNKIPYEFNENGTILNDFLKKHCVQGKIGNFKRGYGEYEISWKIYEVNGFAAIKKRPKIFTHTGELWHHLNNKAIKPENIIEEIGDWIKTDYDVFVKALKKDKIENMTMQKRTVQREFIEITPKSPYKGIAIDHLEVFIERIKVIK